jgi:RNase adapter protein RapZ
MKLMIVSGLSGSGKSVALHTLEDLGYYCIDNLPIGLLQAFAMQMLGARGDAYQRAAVGIDARNRPEDLAEFPRMLRELAEAGVACEIIFLQADDDTLLKRFSETRRKHPLTRREISLADAIRLERGLLEPIAANADLHVDTTRTNIHQLRDLLRERMQRSTRSLSLLFESFGYKHGVPADADFVFDVRCLPNPHWHAELRPLTGLDPAVAQFLEQQPEVSEMFEALKGFLETWIPRFEADNRSYVTVAIGCTGGQHRSVYLAEQLATHFRTIRDNILIRHRELS